MRWIGVFMAAVGAASLAAAGPAAAQEPPELPEWNVSSLDVDPFTLTRLTVVIDCQPDQEPPAAGADCVLPVRLIAREASGEFVPRGDDRPLTEETLTIPAGGRLVRSYDLPPALLRDWVAAGDTGRAVVRAQVAGADTEALAYVALDRSGAVCGIPPVVSFTGAPLLQTLSAPGAPAVRGTVRGELSLAALSRTNRGAARFTVNGLTYAVARGSVFEFACRGARGVAAGRAFPVLLLRSGRVRVSGRPAGARQPAAGVLTGHALVNSRRREAVDLVVVRAPRRTVARVTTGRTVVVTPRGASAGTPCPPGQARAVGPGGVVWAV
jgi:hypothetical protein